VLSHNKIFSAAEVRNVSDWDKTGQQQVAASADVNG
jgi:hypothetical protein